MGLLNSFRDGKDLNWDNWTTSPTHFCWFVAALGLKKLSQPREITPILFHSVNLKLSFIYCLFHCGGCFWGKRHTPKCVIPAIGLGSRLSLSEKQETCNASEYLKPSGLIDWALQRMGSNKMRHYQEWRLGALPNLINVGALQ